MIYGESERLVGSIDFVAMDDEGHLVLFDWKLSKDLRTKYCNTYQRMREPLRHLDDCAGAHYKLPINAYRYILQKILWPFGAWHVRGMSPPR